MRKELKNAETVKAEYKKTLNAPSKGALIRKIINSREYCCIMIRKGEKTRFKYAGKPDKKKIKRYNEAKMPGAKYRNLSQQKCG
ncbi:MAG: hypothetical protein KA120_03225 [Candidatus Goldbacteria bacterium]|nr:hypothetical protein [Candidatus Goldiibacteriota bacterium]